MSSSDVTPNFKIGKTKKKAARTWPSPAEMGRYTCEARCTGCTTRATESHHIVLRSRGGSDEPDNLLATCNSCHRFIHAYPDQATELGFMKRRQP